MSVTRLENHQGRTTMKRTWLLLAGLAVAPLAGLAQTMDFNKVEILTEQLGPNVYMLSGSSGLDPSHEDAAGGRIGVLAGPDGVLMIDSQYVQLVDKVLAAVRRIDRGPIRYLVNTHVHRDHTAGNAFFAKQGAVIFAREELRESMVKLSKAPNASGNPVANPAGFPVITYGMGDPVRIYMNNEVVQFIPIRAAHTGGDTNIKFEKANVLFIGDFYRNYGYPFIDLNNGGTLKGMLEGLDATMKSADANTKLIPGHGTIIKRDDIIPYRDMVVAVTDKVGGMIAQGKSLEEVLAAKVTAPYDAKTAGGTDSSAVRFVTAVYQELKSGRGR
jgi:glyoxylase-like metal-dependent hydrolase (beta-lactamase superfamily II)